VIRQRHVDDLAALERLTEAVYAANGYPHAMPEDVAAFFFPDDLLDAVVIDDGDGRVIGHAALKVRMGGSGAIDLVTGETGRSLEQLAVVTRVMTHPSARRRGDGRRLTEWAITAAAALDRQAWLLVDADATPAIACYAACRFHTIGTVEITFGDGAVVPHLVMVGPDLDEGAR
jgi:ribosomal protein S18 acetylase RimI-like enzyme